MSERRPHGSCWRDRGGLAAPSRPYGQRRRQQWSSTISRVASAVVVPCWGLWPAAAAAVAPAPHAGAAEAAFLIDERPEPHVGQARAVETRLQVHPVSMRSKKALSDETAEASSSFDSHEGAGAPADLATKKPEPGHSHRARDRGGGSALSSEKSLRMAPEGYDKAVKPRPSSVVPSAPPYAEAPPSPPAPMPDRYTRIANDTLKREVEAMVRAEALRALRQMDDIGGTPDFTASFSAAAAAAGKAQEAPAVSFPEAPTLGSAQQQVWYVPATMQPAEPLPIAVYPPGGSLPLHGDARAPPPLSHSVAAAAAVPLLFVDGSTSTAGRALPPNMKGWKGGMMGQGVCPREDKPYFSRTQKHVHPGATQTKVVAVGATCLVGAAAGACVLTTCLKKGRASARETDSCMGDNAPMRMNSGTKTEDVYRHRSGAQSDLQIVGVIPTTPLARV